MRTSDILTRVGGFLMLLSAAMNAFMSLMWIGFMIWFLVGVLWFVPLLLAAVHAVLGIVYLVVGHNKLAIVGPLLGLCISVLNFNWLGGALELGNLCLQIGSYLARSKEQQAEDDLDLAAYAA